MENRLEIRSRDQVPHFRSGLPWIAVSISRNGSWPWISEENRVGLLQVNIQDAISEYDLVYRYSVKDICDRKKAIQILDFVHGHWDKATLMLVQCESGTCCAPAVAAACSYIHWRGAERSFFDRYHPNWFVYSMLLKAHYDRYGWRS